MKPVVATVDALLAAGSINVTVYTGQLDLICCTSGTEAWMGRLQWAGFPGFLASDKVALYAPGSAPGQTGGFRKASGPLAMYYVMDAGHLLPADNGAMALLMLREVVGLPPQ